MSRSSGGVSGSLCHEGSHVPQSAMRILTPSPPPRARACDSSCLADRRRRKRRTKGQGGFARGRARRRIIRARTYTRESTTSTRASAHPSSLVRAADTPHPLREDGMVSRLVYIGLGPSSWCQFSLVEDHPPRGSSARVSSSRPLAPNPRRAYLSRRVPVVHPSSELRRGDSVL